MKTLKILSVDLLPGYEQLEGDCQEVMSRIKAIPDWFLVETDSLEIADGNPVKFDVIIVWINREGANRWQELIRFVQENDLIAICIFTYSEGADEKILDALMRGMYAFVYPFDFQMIEAYIKAAALDVEYNDVRSSFEMSLFKAKSLDEIVKITFSQLKKHPMIGYSRASISLIDEETEKRYLLGYDSEYSDPDRNLMTVISEDPLMENLVEEGVLIIDDFHDEEKLSAIGWKKTGATSDVGSWVGICAMAQDQVVAIITLDHIDKGHYSLCKDKLSDLLKELAESLAYAIVYFVQEKNSVVQEIVREIGDDLRIEELIRQILVKLKDTLQCDNCTYFRVVSQPTEQELRLEEWFSARESSRQKACTFKQGEGIVGAVLSDGKSRIIPHALESEEFVPSFGLTGTNLSMLAVPIIPYLSNEDSESKNRVIGVISCYKKGKKDHFSVYDRDIVRDVAQNTASIIERTMILEYTNDISSKMNDLVLDKDKTLLLKKICEHALRVTNARAAVIHRFKSIKSPSDSDSQQVYIATGESYAYPENINYHSPRLHGSGTTDIVIREKDTVEFSEERGNLEYLSDSLRDEGIKHQIVIPLMVKKEENQECLIGALYLNKYSGESFSKAEKFALKLFASQAANTIYHQEFLFERQTWTEGNTSLAKAIEVVAGNDDQDSLLYNIVNYACSLADAKFSELSLLNSDNQLETKAVWPDRMLNKVSRFREDDNQKNSKLGITGLVAKYSKSILIGDIKMEMEDNSEYENHYLEFREETHSELAVPIIETKSGKAEVIGVINLEHDKPYAFTELHKTVIELFAKQVAIALQKKHLVESIKSRNRILIGLQESLQKTIESSPHSMLHNAVLLTREATHAKDVIVIPFPEEDVADNRLPKEAGTVTGIDRHFLVNYLQQTSSRVHSMQESVYLGALGRDGREEDKEKLYELKISSGLCLPFSVQMKKLGVMWIFFSKSTSEDMPEDDKAIYQVYANQIALAYANSQQSEELKLKVRRGEDELAANVNRDYKDARMHARIYFLISLITSIAGLILIFYGVPQALNSSSPNSNQGGGFVAAVFGLVLEGATVLAFERGKAANERMDRYHRELFNLQKLSILLSAAEQLD